MASIIFSKSITDPIHRLIGDMKKVSEGDLTLETEFKSGDEIGELYSMFNRMKGSMKHLIKDIMIVSKEVNDSSTILSSTSQEVNASIEEISSNATKVSEESRTQYEEIKKARVMSDELSEAFNHLHEILISTLNFSDEIRETSNQNLNLVHELEEKTALNE